MQLHHLCAFSWQRVIYSSSFIWLKLRVMSSVQIFLLTPFPVLPSLSLLWERHPSGRSPSAFQHKDLCKAAAGRSISGAQVGLRGWVQVLWEIQLWPLWIHQLPRCLKPGTHKLLHIPIPWSLLTSSEPSWHVCFLQMKFVTNISISQAVQSRF